MQLHLKLEQLDASIRAVNSRSATLEAQLRTQSIQMNTMEREGRRIENLLKDGAATPKQKDDIEAGMEVLLSQMKGLETQKATIAAEKNTLRVQKEQLRDQIRRSLITNPIEGVVLQKYKQEGEIVGPGQAIYKIADLDILILRAYISGKQLSSVSIGQNVIVRIDGPDGLEEMEGKVEWISSQAEFTPKIIQTREERVNLVYAIKVQVKNDGRLKIGMPGEIKL
jgi:HlyD family secretion protein